VNGAHPPQPPPWVLRPLDPRWKAPPGQGVRSERYTPDNPLDPPFDKFGLCHYNHARWNGLTFGAG